MIQVKAWCPFDRLFFIATTQDDEHGKMEEVRCPYCRLPINSRRLQAVFAQTPPTKG